MAIQHLKYKGMDCHAPLAMTTLVSSSLREARLCVDAKLCVEARLSVEARLCVDARLCVEAKLCVDARLCVGVFDEHVGLSASNPSLPPSC